MHRHHCLYCQIQTEPLDAQIAQPDRRQKLGRLALTFALATLYSGFELITGEASHSLSLLADAGHMVSDSFGLGIALVAAWWGQHQLHRARQVPIEFSGESPTEVSRESFTDSSVAPERVRTIEAYTALINSSGLLLMAIWISWETWLRFQADQPEIYSAPMILAAAVGLVVHGVNAMLLYRYSRQDLNLRGAFLHVLADAIGSVGILLAAIAVGYFHWPWVDGVVGLLTSGLIAIAALPLIGDSLGVLARQSTALPSEASASSEAEYDVAPWDIAYFSQHMMASAKVVKFSQTYAPSSGISSQAGES